MFNFGTTVKKIKKVNDLDTKMVLIMRADVENTRKKFTFSELAYATLDFNLDSPIAGMINQDVSIGIKSDGLGTPIGFSIFINNQEVATKLNRVGKTSQGFTNQDLYEKLTAMYGLDNTTDTVFNIVRSASTEAEEKEYGITVYDLEVRVEQPEIEETPYESLETVVLNDNSEEVVTLD